MIIEKKYLVDGMDGDSSLRLVGDKATLNVMNAKMAISQYGRNLRLQNIPGTTKISQSVYPPYGTQQVIGSAVDPATNRLVYAVWNSFEYHGIYCFDFTTRTTYAVLYDTQVTTGLNFSKSFRIDRDCHITNGLFYFTDFNNQPRKVNIDAGIKANHPSYSTDTVAYSFPLSEKEITIIKPPPPLSPNIEKKVDVTFENNFIANDSFEFVFMYDYYDNERTVVGTYSPASRLNKTTDTENYIEVTMDFLEVIPSTVKAVHLVVRIGNGEFSGGNTARIIKTWDKNSATDAAEILAQNDHTQVLTFDFYNNVTGEAIPSADVLKPFDNVPIKSKTLSIAKNRNFLGNNVAGYDTPTTTSLSLQLTEVNIGGTVLNKNLIELRHRNGRGGDINYAYSSYYVFLTASEAAPGGWFELTSTAQTTTPSSSPYPTLPPPPPSFAFGGLTFRGSTLSQVALATAPSGTYRWDGPFTVTTSNIVQITGTVVDTYDIFKTLSHYKTGVVFYDFAMRKCGVVTNDGLTFEIPTRNYDFSTGVNGVTWTLSNSNALNEIPDWAYYYTPVRTLNLTTRFFISSYTNAAKYATKDANGNYLFTSTTFVTGAVGIGLNTTPLVQSGLGYTFTQGDICVLTRDDDTQYQLPVLGQEGSYIIVKAENVGDISNKQFVYEIYTPYQTSEQEPFYEVGQMYRITDPGTSSRQYETLSDVFVPDAYVLTRTYSTATYFAEAMCPNDLFYQRWDNDGGKPNFITTLGQVEKKNFFSYSDPFIPGTSINGLSTFGALSQSNVPEDSGEINKLILTTKVEDKGTVMLAICRNETNSIYLGEQQISDSTGQTQFFANASGVVGTINSLKGSYGTVNKESVFEYLGLVFWIDVLNGVVAQYSSAGLEPVSRYNQQRFFQRYSLDYLAASTGNLDNINGFHHIPSCVDPFTKEAMFTLPGLIYENYADTLPSYSSVPSYATSIINRFDIYDQLGKTMMYSFVENKWGNDFEFMGEWYDYMQNSLIGFKNGDLYIHNDDNVNWNRFYGVHYPARICFTWNNNPSAIKDVFGIAIEGSVAPDFTVLYSDNPNVQITDLTSDDYENQEGVFYATFFRDRLSPNVSGTATQKMKEGDIIKSPYPLIMLEFQQYNDLMFIDFVNLHYDISIGQKQLLNKF